MATDAKSGRSSLMTTVKEIFGLDLRSLAAFRIGLAIILLVDLTTRMGDLTAHYTDAGIMPLTLLQDIGNPWHWSLYGLSGQPLVVASLFGIAWVLAVAMLVGYHTRSVTIASWALLLSLHNRNPALLFAADHVLLALMFWSMFLPLGACYSIDSALNTASRPRSWQFLSGATAALMVQQSFIYIFSAAIKTKSPIWTDGSAVYYSLSFDQYVTPLGHFLLNFSPLLVVFTYVTLVLEWVGPLLLFSPVRTQLVKTATVFTFILLHIGFGSTLNIGVFPFLSAFSWLAFLPSSFWDGLQKRCTTPQRQGLKIYYDADCGFCKKVVHLLRTFLILPGTPLLMAQEDPDIYADMQTYNSWVIVDWQGNRHFKFAGIAYVVSLSPVFRGFVPLLRWKPIMTVGTRFYEAIATNRKTAGFFTRPLKFRPREVKPSRFLNILVLVLLFYTFLWNIRSYAPDLFKRRTWQQTAFVGQVLRLDQSWSIFAPAPPRDDGWHVIPGRLQDGREVDVFRDGAPVIWDKPSLGERSRLYRNMQWRTYFINLNRAIGTKLYPDYAQYICRNWNAHHSGASHLEQFEIYFMDERTVPPGAEQTVKPERIGQQSCPPTP